MSAPGGAGDLRTAREDAEWARHIDRTAHAVADVLIAAIAVAALVLMHAGVI